MGKRKLKCIGCKVVFYDYKKDKKYCNRVCFYRHYVVWNKNKKIPFQPRSKGQYLACANCHQQWWKCPSSAQSKYCSARCYFQARWGSGHREIRKCASCSKTWECRKSSQIVCCSKECRQELLATRYLGDKSHFWRGGKTAPYHTDWKPARRKALRRDGYKCAICGKKKSLNVHHRIPYRYSKSHDLDNLITLCRSCHSKEEFKVNPFKEQRYAQGRASRLR